MGAWAIDALANDDAADFLDAMYAGDSVTVIDNAISGALIQDALEAPEAQAALAAAEVVARLGRALERNAPPNEELDAWILANKLVLPPDFAHRACLAIDRILDEGSELYELWQESDEFEAWLTSIESLRQRLEGENLNL